MAPTRTPLAHWPRRVLDWLCGGREDYRAFQARKATRVYQSNRNICLLIWACAAALLLVCGGGACLLTIGLIATLLCFAMLDPD